jgi:hypothetical protein
VLWETVKTIRQRAIHTTKLNTSGIGGGAQTGIAAMPIALPHTLRHFFQPHTLKMIHLWTNGALDQVTTIIATKAITLMYFLLLGLAYRNGYGRNIPVANKHIMKFIYCKQSNSMVACLNSLLDG